MARLTEQQLSDARRRYVDAFDDTMIKIWQEKIVALKIIDTGALFSSVTSLPPIILKSDYSSFTLKQDFLLYGLYQDLGVGREVWRGNGGDISRHFNADGTRMRVEKVRQRRRWFSKKYFASTMNLKDFMLDNLGQRFFAIISNSLNV